MYGLEGRVFIESDEKSLPNQLGKFRLYLGRLEVPCISGATIRDIER